MIPALSLGVEYNPGEDEVGPLVNWIALGEGALRPALIFGTSSDRIGTPGGRAYFATLSKDLSPWLGVPLAPYIGVSYGTFDDRLRPIGGLSVWWGERWSSLLIHDGVSLHPTLSYALGNRTQLMFLMVRSRDPGFSVSVSF